MIRYENEKLVDWLNRFQTPITKLEVAEEQRITDEAELKQFWKDIFAGNISSAEHTIIGRDMAALKLDPSADFGEDDHKAIEQYRFTVFDVITFHRMLVQLKSFQMY